MSKVLLAGFDMKELTGAPIYNYNLAKGLIELGHEVTCVGISVGGTITKWLEKLGATVHSYIYKERWGGKYDLVIISENMPEIVDSIKCDRIYNFCHSKGESDRPISDREITGYLFPRKQVQEYWGEKGQIIPIPIDIDRFKNVKREKQERYTILAPCTIDSIRRAMLINLFDRDADIWIVGKDHGGLNSVEIPNNVTIFPEIEDITEYMRKVDEVAGIYIGTVTLEAWVMGGIKTSVYDEEGNWEYVKPYDIKANSHIEIAKQFIELI